jgi:hypothetical protein
MDIVCFLTREMHIHEELQHRTATLLTSPERLSHLRGQFFDWIYIDDYDVDGVFTAEMISEVWMLMDRARKGVVVSIQDQATCQYFNLNEWKFIELGDSYF